MKLNTKQQKQLAFLEDTVKYYSEDTSRRSFKPEDKAHCSDAISCRYYFNGKRCAIGRHVPIRLCKIFDKYEDTSVENEDIFNNLSTELKELGIVFLREIQMFHDDNDYWGKNKLTTKGKRMVKSIKKDILSGTAYEL